LDLIKLRQRIVLDCIQRMADGKSVVLVTPGERLGHISEFTAGPGTYLKGGYIHSSIVGAKTITPKAKESEVCVCSSVIMKPFASCWWL